MADDTQALASAHALRSLAAGLACYLHVHSDQRLTWALPAGSSMGVWAIQCVMQHHQPVR